MDLNLDDLAERIGLRDSHVSSALGNELKTRRKKAGMSLRDVSNLTRIAIPFLEAIEAGDYTSLPGGKHFTDTGRSGVYVRGFLRAYAGCLKLTNQITIDSYSATAEVETPGSLPLPLGSPQSSLTRSDLVEPPKFGEYLLYFLLTKPERVYLIGDLREEYQELAGRFGARKATLWFYKQVLASLRPLIYRSLSKIRAVISLVDLIRQFFK